ncbi:MAG: YfiR family protein [Candidatus Eisenbacteria bacterium]|uniref:YfiR family protein n=1 Tax=Eiseniibacteriota bacterium TaxID=2212470 RepID=A0A956NBM6_UNCEI|nr:YfiR family protein [Candidatus Eisenbacteria bacterium]MCB9466310.1 YfiR family protein [Candidatus Eisenbacteria bacterium]
MTRRCRTLAWLLLWASILALPGTPDAILAEESASAVPWLVQVAIVKKILPFDESIDDTGVRLWVVGEAPGEITADSLSALFAAAGVESLSADEAPEAGRGSVAYLLPSGRPYGERLTSRGVLTIAAIPPSDTPSPVVIGLTLVEGKPKIVVSRSALESSGHKLSAKLLRICSLVE